MKGDMLPVYTDLKISVCIFNYIKVENKETGNLEKVGVMLACKFNDDNVYLGWSKCHADDAFDYTLAFDLAIFRAYASKLAGEMYTGKEFLKPIEVPEYVGLPNSMENDMLKFLKRVNSYYKLGAAPFEFKVTDLVDELEAFPQRGFIMDEAFAPFGPNLPKMYGMLSSLLGAPTGKVLKFHLNV